MSTKTNKGFKTGRFTKEEKRFIVENLGTMMAESIAKALNRRTENVQREIDKQTAMVKPPAEIVAEKKRSKAWDLLQKEFTSEEIKFIGQEYQRLIEQFHQNITPSEEIQLLDYVKMSVLVTRSNTQKKDLLEHIDETEKTLKEFAANNKSELKVNPEVMKIYGTIQDTLASLEKAMSMKTDEFCKLQKQKDDILKSLKGTRDQRMKHSVDSGKFLTILEQYREVQNQEMESKHVELIRRSKEDIKKKWQEPFKYVTGEVDQPLMTPDMYDETLQE